MTYIGTRDKSSIYSIIVQPFPNQIYLLARWQSIPTFIKTGSIPVMVTLLALM
jgi:hypothetical protein